MTPAQAAAVYDLLIAHAGAFPEVRDEFVRVAGQVPEYRFCGGLGLGGKFRTADWSVSAYPEDLRRWPAMRLAVDATNAALAGLRELHLGQPGQNVV